jgi:hypothetical protein
VTARVLLFLAMLVPLQEAWGQGDPLRGPITLSVEEFAADRRGIMVSLATVGEYGCENTTIAAQQTRVADTIGITITGLVPNTTCADMMAPGRARIPLALAPGRYVVSVRRLSNVDRVGLVVTQSRLVVRRIEPLVFIQPDTSAFRRPTANSFFISCGTPNVPELCADLAAWLSRQPGIVRRPLSASDRIGFIRYGGTWYSDYQLYDYRDGKALRAVRHCMRQIADTLSAAVGADIELQTAEGEILRAWSHRAFHEPHIEVPRKVSGSRGCP